jgi:predicted transposase YdaD
MLGILANFGDSNTYDVVKTIVNEIHLSAKNELNTSKYFKQLRILAQLRLGVEQEILKAMEGISSFFKIENDLWYRKGEEKGKIEGKQEQAQDVVANLLSEFSFSDEQAARAANVPVEFIRKVRAELEKK